MTTSKWLAIIFMLNVLMAGCSSIINPGPIPAAAEIVKAPFGEGNKEIISAQWMRSDFSGEIKNLSAGDTVGVLIKTKNYTSGESVTVELSDEQTNDDGGSYTVIKRITGVVDEHGEVRVLIKS